MGAERSRSGCLGIRSFAALRMTRRGTSPRPTACELWWAVAEVARHTELVPRGQILRCAQDNNLLGMTVPSVVGSGQRGARLKRLLRKPLGVMNVAAAGPAKGGAAPFADEGVRAP